VNVKHSFWLGSNLYYHDTSVNHYTQLNTKAVSDGCSKPSEDRSELVLLTTRKTSCFQKLQAFTKQHLGSLRLRREEWNCLATLNTVFLNIFS